MASPEKHLPPALTDGQIHSLLRSLDLPPAIAIEAFQAAAAFHSIYLLTFAATSTDNLKPATARNDDGTATLVLRVSGRHLPCTKTMNEVAVMRWIAQHTTVPVPAVVRFDASCRNALGYEFTLLEKVPGASVDKMYASLAEDVKMKLVEQLTDIVLELNSFEWSHVGGLEIDQAGDIIPGQVLEDTFWFVPDVEEYWNASESTQTLNPTGPYNSHASFVTGYLECFVHAINNHSTLKWLSDLVPRLEALGKLLSAQPSPLSPVRLILAHKDLHFANIMATPDGHITGIIDWEFAGVVPALRWDPVRAFLWNGTEGSEAHEEKGRMRGIFEAGLGRRGVKQWWLEGLDAEIESVWTVVSFTRALVEVCPRKQREELVDGWKQKVVKALDDLGL